MNKFGWIPQATVTQKRIDKANQEWQALLSPPTDTNTSDVPMGLNLPMVNNNQRNTIGGMVRQGNLPSWTTKGGIKQPGETASNLTRLATNPIGGVKEYDVSTPIPFDAFKMEYFQANNAPEVLLKNRGRLTPQENRELLAIESGWYDKARQAYNDTYGQGSELKATLRAVPRKIGDISGFGQGVGNIISKKLEPTQGLGAVSPMDIGMATLDLTGIGAVARKPVQTAVNQAVKGADRFIDEAKPVLSRLATEETGAIGKGAGKKGAKPRPTTPPTKEPWQMTQDELVANRMEELRNSTMWANSPPQYKRTLESSSRIKAENEWLKLNENAYIDGNEVPLSGRPDWSLTAKQFADRSDDTLDQYIIKSHDQSVKQAIDEGKPVPSEVLKDYQSRLPSKPIQVDDDVIWHSPHTNEDVTMNFRGYSGDKAVLYNKQSGMQLSVPKDQIKPITPKAETPVTKEPWQMTREELKSRFPRISDSDLAQFVGDDAIVIVPDKFMSRESMVWGTTAGGKTKTTLEELPHEIGHIIQGKLGIGDNLETKVLNKLFKDQKLPIINSKTGEPMMDTFSSVGTQSEYLAEAYARYIKNQYLPPKVESYVKALSEGKPVPESVLKDYPDLVKKPVTPTNVTQGVENITKNRVEIFKEQALKKHTKTDVNNFLRIAQRQFSPYDIVEYRPKLQVIVKENGTNVLYDYSPDRKALVRYNLPVELTKPVTPTGEMPYKNLKLNRSGTGVDNPADVANFPPVEKLNDQDLWKLVQTPSSKATPEVAQYLKQAEAEFGKRKVELKPIISAKPAESMPPASSQRTPIAPTSKSSGIVAQTKEVVPQTVYHGTDLESATNIQKSGIKPGTPYYVEPSGRKIGNEIGFSLTRNREIAQKYGENVLQYSISPEAKIATPKDLPSSVFKDVNGEILFDQSEVIKLAQKKGFDGIDLDALEKLTTNPGRHQEIQIWNTKVLEPLDITPKLKSSGIDTQVSGVGGEPPKQPPKTATGGGIEPPKGKKATTGSGEPPKGKAGFAGNIRLNKFPEEMHDSLKQWATDEAKVQMNRRGTRSNSITMQAAQEIADETGGNPQKIAQKLGQAYNAEEVAAIGGMKTQAYNELKQIEDLVSSGQDTTANLARLQKARYNYAYWVALRTRSAAEAGRALQIFKHFNNAIKSQDEKVLEKVLKQIGGREKAEQFAEALKALDWNDPVAINKFIRSVNKPSFKDYSFEWYVNAILSGPKTQIVNTLSNTMTALISPVETAGSVAFGKILRTGGNRYFGEAAHEAAGAIQGFKDGVRGATHTLRYGIRPDAISKLEFRPSAFSGKTGRVINAPSTALEAADELFYNVNYRMSLNKQAYQLARSRGITGKKLTDDMADLIANPTDEIVARASKEAHYRLFRQEAGSATKKLMGIREDIPILKFFVPFLRTPVNLVKFGLERSPLGFVNPKLWHNLVGRNPEAADQLARAFIGTTVATALYFYVIDDKITGGAPTSASERDKFYAEGKQPYAIKIGKWWISYQRLEPFNQLFSQLAALVDAKGQDEKTVGEKLGVVAQDIGRNFVSQTYMSGIQDIMDALEDPEKSGTAFVNRLAGSMLPFSALNRTVAQSIDTTIRQPTNVLEGVEANIPGLSKNVPAKTNSKGVEQIRQSPAWSPISITQDMGSGASASNYQPSTFNARKSLNSQTQGGGSLSTVGARKKLK